MQNSCSNVEALTHSHSSVEPSTSVDTNVISTPVPVIHHNTAQVYQLQISGKYPGLELELLVYKQPKVLTIYLARILR